MLVSYGKQNLINILIALEKTWGFDVNILKIDIKNAPFGLMDIEVQIYKKYRILLAYDRSLLGIFIMRNGEPVHISKFTKQELITGFEVCKKEENLLHNFHILDDVLKALDRQN